MIIPLQSTSHELWQQKYQLKDDLGNPIDVTIQDTYKRVAKALPENETDKEKWEKEFLWALNEGASPAGRILANAGASEYKPSTSLINCTVSQIIDDSIDGILDANMQAGITLSAGCGIGYEFSTLRPKGAFVKGAGASTSGPLSFMNIFDSMCDTISSAGGRRGAQMGTFAIWHPDVEDFIRAKREDGRLRKFNLSLLIDNEFMEAVKEDKEYPLVFPIKHYELKNTKNTEILYKSLFWDKDYCLSQDYIVSEDDKIACKVYKTIKAKDLWNTVMMSTYDYAEPGFLLIDRINDYNNNWFMENIRATNPCGEQPLPPEGSCLLGSVNLALFVKKPFTKEAYFDWETYKKNIHVFTRLLDNVVESNGLPLEGQRHEIEYKRRHGMGITGLGSMLSLMGIRYGSKEAIKLLDKVMEVMAVEGYREGLALAKEKGPAPIFNDFTNGVSNKDLWVESKYMQNIFEVAPELKEEFKKYGCRFTHHTSIAPTGTISFTINNNVSNGIEPTFSHQYTRNVIVEGQKAKKAIKVYSYEMLLYKHLTGEEEVPSDWSTTDNLTPEDHLIMQATAQKWVDSSISKTINVPTETDFDSFKNIYMRAYDLGLKGCTTFRFNPETLQGVLVKDSDLENTKYVFVLEDGTELEFKGNDLVEYEGQEYTAQNLFDSVKEGYYGQL